MNDLTKLSQLLNKVEDSYFDFVSAMLHYAEKKPARLEALLSFMSEHPKAKSSDIVRFVSEQPDFYEDAAYDNGI